MRKPCRLRLFPCKKNGTALPFRSCGWKSADDGQTFDIDFRCAHQILVDLAPDFDLGVGIDALACEIFFVDFDLDGAGSVGELVHVVGEAVDDLAAQGDADVIDRVFQDFGNVFVGDCLTCLLYTSPSPRD